jgi:2-polyprenyl-3-methyl-5-hydroxy-6-metoxy-1,4-benzoquinol methylase
MTPSLAERTNPGLHDAVFSLLGTLHVAGPHACDLGAGSGAWSQRLAAAGYEVLSIDRDLSFWRGTTPFVEADLNERDLSARLTTQTFDLVTAIEVIEHLEAPIAFLRTIRELLAPSGIAIVTTPNVDSLPARLKFLLKDKWRMLDEFGDPTHISPIFIDLLKRQYLPMSGLTLQQHVMYPQNGFITGRPLYTTIMTPFSALLTEAGLGGDNHIFVMS